MKQFSSLLIDKNEVSQIVNSGRSESAKATEKIAVLIPCYNEELTIAEVVNDFARELPEADIYVFDNNSKDKTVEKAIEANAIIRYEKRQGKGFVVQKMFREVDADVYIMVDGDSTYPASEVHRLIAPVLSKEADMVIGSRLMPESDSQFKKLNRFGNNIFLWTINYIFRVKLTDILSGYRAFSRNFVKNLPLFGGGFETETELTIKALARGYQISEIPINLGVRPSGSNSKIKIWRDGLLIFNMIFCLFRDYKPLTFFGLLGFFLMIPGTCLGGLVIYEFIETGLVARLPSALLAVGLEISGLLSLTVGLVLHTVVRRSQELEYQIRLLSDKKNK